MDWFEFRAYGTFGKLWKERRKELEAKKAEAQETRRVALLELDAGDVVGVRPKGYAKWDAEFPWVLEWQGGSIALSDQDEREDDAPAVLCQFTSLPCMLKGPQFLLDGSMGLLCDWDWQFERTLRATRLDLASDVAGRGIAEFVDAYWANRFVTDCRSDEAPRINGMHNNVRFGKKGKKSVQFEVYNKLLEVFTKNGPKVPVMFERWGGQFPDQAIRAEVRIPGGYWINKAFEIRTAQDSLDFAPQMAEYFGTKWLRFTEEVNEKQNQGRLMTAAMWEDVMSGYRTGLSKSERDFERQPKRLASDVEGLSRQWRGCARSQFVYTHPEPTWDEFEAFVIDELRKHRAEDEEKLDSLAAVYEATKALPAADDPNAGGIPF